MQQWGNKRAAAFWEYHLPEGFHRPVHSDAEMEAFIRAKYERKKVRQSVKQNKSHFFLFFSYDTNSMTPRFSFIYLL